MMGMRGGGGERIATFQSFYASFYELKNLALGHWKYAYLLTKFVHNLSKTTKRMNKNISALRKYDKAISNLPVIFLVLLPIQI